MSRSVANLIASEAASFNGQVVSRMSIARTEADAGGEMIGTSRAQVMAVEHQILVQNPSIAGAYIDYRPNAFDNDARYRNILGSNKQGIFGSYWNRLGGKNNLSYGMAGNYQSLAWWQQPERSGGPSYIEPYLWEGSLLASTTVPIHHDGHFVGVAGIDGLLKALDHKVGSIRILQHGYSFVVSHGGLLVSYPHQKLVGHQTLLGLAKSTHTPAFAKIYAALRAGRTGSIQARDPTVEIPTATSDEIGDVARSFGQITDYLSEMASVADQIAAGRLDAEVPVRSERDQLGRAIASMRDHMTTLIRRITRPPTPSPPPRSRWRRARRRPAAP